MLITSLIMIIITSQIWVLSRSLAEQANHILVLLHETPTPADKARF